MKKTIILALALLMAVLVCSCAPDADDPKRPLLGFSFTEERQFRRLTNSGNDTLAVFHLIQKGEEAYYHVEKSIGGDYHEYTNLYEEFEWAFENIGLEAKGTFEENWIMIEGRVDASTYEAFIFCREENAESMAAKLAGGVDFYGIIFERTDVVSRKFFDPHCGFGVKFQTVTARRGF